MVDEECVEIKATADIRRPRCVGQVGMCADHAGATRLSENPAGPVLVGGTAAEVESQSPQRVPVAVFVNDGDEADVTHAALVGGLRGVREGEGFSAAGAVARSYRSRPLRELQPRREVDALLHGDIEVGILAEPDPAPVVDDHRRDCMTARLR